MQTVTKKDNFKLWVEKTNLISEEQGNLDNLYTTVKSDVVSSINEVFTMLNTKLSDVVEDQSPELG